MNPPVDFEFCGRPLGAGHPPVIVAEVGFNHNGDAALARRMIEAAAQSGADAVKLQTFVAGEFISRRHRAVDPEQPDNEIPIYEFFQRSELTRDEYEALFEHARGLGVPLFSTPFDEASLELLIDCSTPALKVASPDLTHLAFIRQMADCGVPLVISTGMGTHAEIAAALKAAREAGNERLVLLHCVSNYPSRHEEMNLRCLEKLQQAFQVPVGLSDHTTDNLSAIVAASLGAVMIEKHFTIDRALPGADNAISMQPEDLRALVQATRAVPKILGDGERRLQDSEIPVKAAARRSLVARCDIEAGTVLSQEMIAAKRPGTGIAPAEIGRLLGKKLKTQILEDQLFDWDMV